MIWNEEFETLPREALEALQLKRLRGLVDRVYTTVPFYRRKLEEQGYRQGDIRSLPDLSRLPFTTKTDLRDTYPFGMFAVPMERVVRIHASSGTTGKPVVVGYTMPTGTVFSRGAWGPITARRRSARPSSPCPGGTASARSC
jgi:phenylacetate-CoA ligase